MVADVGWRGEKYHEYRNASKHWNERLTETGSGGKVKEFRHVMVFGGVQVPEVDGNWFIAKWVKTTPVDGPMEVGPYSNGAKKSFVGRVWDIELGTVCSRHNAVLGNQSSSDTM
jgi:hypothetical protein